jgi:hypothetical protein
MCDGRTAEGLSEVTESEVLVMFVKLYGKSTATNISERHNVV